MISLTILRYYGNSRTNRSDNKTKNKQKRPNDTEKQTDKRTIGQTDRQTDRQTYVKEIKTLENLFGSLSIFSTSFLFGGI